MKTFVQFTLCGLLLCLTACSSNDAGSGMQDEASVMASLTFPGGDCFTMDEDACQAFKATNMQRAMRDLPALTFCQKCYEMAAEQSRDMYVRGYFDHNRPEESFAQRATRFTLNKGAGENLAYGQVGEVVVDLWMTSPGHRDHIIDPKFKSMGVATFGLYTTQVFYVGTDR